MINIDVSQIGRTILAPSPIERILKKKTPRTMKRIGAYVRKVAMRSIRNKKKASQPGEPPTNRTGKLKKNILFYYDSSHEVVFIGASGFPNHDKGAKTLEEGGNVKIPKLWQKRLFRVGAPANQGGVGPVVILTHPDKYAYMWDRGPFYKFFFMYSLDTEKKEIKDARYLYVIWRHLRTEKEALIAEQNYHDLVFHSGGYVTNKKVGKVEKRPYMLPSLENSEQFIIDAWKDSLK